MTSYYFYCRFICLFFVFILFACAFNLKYFFCFISVVYLHFFVFYCCFFVYFNLFYIFKVYRSKGTNNKRKFKIKHFFIYISLLFIYYLFIYYYFYYYFCPPLLQVYVQWGCCLCSGVLIYLIYNNN